MTFHLSHEQVGAFEKDGYLAPLAFLSSEEVAAARQQFEAFERRIGPSQSPALRTDLHLIQQWAWQLANDPRVVVPVTDLLGPNVLLWSLNWFIKEPGDGKYVSFHQDATYWGLEPHDVLTAWIAVSDTAAATGPMQFIPGTHRSDILPHEDTHDASNLLTRGQQIADADANLAVTIPLAAGEMSLHHVRLVHGSQPNLSDDRRIGMVLRFAATHVRQTKVHDTAVLVAGADDYGHFELLPAPDVDFGAAEMARQKDALARMTKALYSDNEGGNARGDESEDQQAATS